jgi:hypothetical protein
MAAVPPRRVLACGSPARQWGLPEFAHLAHEPTSAITFLSGHGRFLALLFSALLPALLLYWRRDATLPAVGLSLALFLCSALPSAPSTWRGHLPPPISSASGQPLFTPCQPEPSWRKVYNRWNGGLPWDVARSRPLLPEEVAALAVVWALLLLVVIVGLRRITKPEGAERLPMLEQSA